MPEQEILSRLIRDDGHLAPEVFAMALCVDDELGADEGARAEHTATTNEERRLTTCCKIESVDDQQKSLEISERTGVVQLNDGERRLLASRRLVHGTSQSRVPLSFHG